MTVQFDSSKALKIKIASIFLLWISAFIPVYVELFKAWFNHSNNSHGLLVPFISGFLIWQERNELSKTQIKNSKLGLLILCLSLVLYIITLAGSLAVATRVMIIFSLIGLILYNFGREFFLKIWFPLLFLIFMVPIPVSIYNLTAFPMQLFASNLSADLLKLLTIPVYCEGNMLYFTKAQLEVAEACSGLRSLTSYIMLSFLFAYIMDSNWSKRIFIIVASIPLAILANVVRVTGTGVLAHLYGEQYARGFLHSFSGFAVFIFGFMFLFLIYLLLNRTSRNPI